MKAAIINRDNSSGLPLKEVMETFFSNNTPDRVKFLFWKLLQCYMLKDCVTKVEVPEKEVAQFYDQLMDLVTAAYSIYQARSTTNSDQEGGSHV